jgi:hypothetical protein
VNTSPAATGGGSGLRAAAMMSYAAGLTGDSLRARAADPLLVEGVAKLAGSTEEETRGQMLAVAATVDLITREGLTREQCVFLLGADEARDGGNGARS